MAYSLLAHLYPYIKGSQEDIATFSLQYLLMQSDKLNFAFTKRVAADMQIKLEDTLRYACQVSGDSEERERPDMVGIDSQGNELLLFEMKFYASLTVNQPITYLKRLRKQAGEGLMFVCPSARKTNLWSKLKELCGDMDIQEVNEYCILADGVKMAIITWNEVIELLKQVAMSVDISFLPDIAQLEGYCNQLDSDAFLPFSEDDISALSAKREERYYMVLDEVMELLMADNTIRTSKAGTKATAYRKGYTRSLLIDDFSITLNYDRDLWKKPSSVETPFWVTVRDSNWKSFPEAAEIFKYLPEQWKEVFWNSLFLAVEPLQRVTFSEVCEDIKTKILRYVDMVREFY